MSTSINQRMTVHDWIMLLTLSILWGGSFFFVELVVTQLPPLTIVLARVLLASIALWLFVFVLGLRPPFDGRSWGAFFIMGLINNVLPFSLLVWGQIHIASGLAAILNATAPLFTVVIAGIWLKDEALTLSKLGGILLGLIGVILMIGPAALGDLSVGSNLLAQLAVLTAAACYAFAAVFGRGFKRMGINPVIIAAGQVTASSLILMPIVFYFEPPQLLAMPSGNTIMALLALGLLSTALAYILYFRILASAGATNLLLVAFLIPLTAILLGLSLLGETLAPIHFAGMALIGFGLLAIDGRLWRRRPALQHGD